MSTSRNSFCLEGEGGGNELNRGQAPPRAPSWLVLQWSSPPLSLEQQDRNEERKEAAHRQQNWQEKKIGRSQSG
jgi:hypothetical protein